MDIRRILDNTISGSFWKQILFTAALSSFVFTFFVAISFVWIPDKFSINHPKAQSSISLEKTKGGFFGDDDHPMRQPRKNNSLSEKQDSLQCNIFNNEIKGKGSNRYWGLLSQFLDPGNIDKADDEYRLFITLLTLAGSATLGGLFIATLSNALERRVDKIKNGEVRYYLNKHAVIIGYDPYAITLIKKIAQEKNTSAIILFTSKNPIEVTKQISTFLDKKEERRLIVYHGGRDSSEQISSLSVHRASSIYILGESDESERDSMNLYCFKLVKDALVLKNNNRQEPLICHVLLQHYKEYQLTQQYDFDEAEKKLLDFQPLNFHEEWSRIILSDLSMCLVDQKTNMSTSSFSLPAEQLCAGSPKHLHLIIIGFEEMGKVFAAHAMRVLHFPNLSTTRITIIDPNVSEEFDLFSSYFPGYEAIYDIAFELLAETPFSSTTRSYLETLLADENVLPYIVISLPDSDRSLAAGLNLPVKIYQKGVPVIIRYSEYNGISNLIHHTAIASKQQPYAQVRFWGMMDALFFDNKNLALREAFAESAHNAYLNTAKQLNFYDCSKESNKEYPQLKAVYQWANRYLADSYQIKLRSAGLYVVKQGAGYDTTRYQAVTEFEPASIDLIAQTEHARWVAERVVNGWIYGEKRDDRFKIHQDIAPWEQINDFTRQYDYALISNMIQNLIEHGYTVVREVV